MQVKVKICGVTDAENSVAVVDAGADAVGLNFVPSSKRRVTAGQANRVIEAIAGRAIVVGVFADMGDDQVRSVLDQVPLDVLQFHGSEPAAFCSSFERKYIRAVRARNGAQVERILAEYQDAYAILFDGPAPGTGEPFDWSLWPSESTLPLMLAGGLAPDNVGEGVRRLRPMAVDVASGVEAGRPGIKDLHKVHEFISEVRRAER